MTIDIGKQKLFSELVDKAIVLSRQINSLLDTELDALSGKSPELLESIIKDKKQYLIAISNVMAEQQSLLSSMQLGHDAKGVSILYTGLPDNHPARKNWSILQKLAKIMADNNLRNGIMVNQRTDSTRMALDILTGNRSDQSVYQYGGRTETSRQCKSLAYA